MDKKMTIVDIWGGEGNMDHLARFILEPSDALKVAEHELRSGFLVNLRNDIAWGSFTSFDIRN